ncbi:MAG: pantoate--beta-alanine ligase [Candidatus Omnitrophica bacterium]|jgi:pantoate--beta-alanine ligase|nr:pantoate--beta-alanine ligase [Candidatus Omnitrophota bacterium]
MKIIRLPAKLAAYALRLKRNQQSIGLVPTMGALHDGHLSLICSARKENDFVCVSIFINPKQFSAREDFKKYPRPLSKDLELCRKAGVDIVFLPEAEDIYPEGFGSFVDLPAISSLLCGKTRPGHFRGVATIVLKLFNITRADNAYFGQKDAQQAVVISRMISDLNLPVKLRVMPIVRCNDGLALSSRNVYLNKQQRQDAVVLYQALCLARCLIDHGLVDTQRLLLRMRQLIAKHQTAKIDYITAVDLNSLKPIKRISQGCLIALAVKFGKTRLIDNIVI